MPTTGSKMRKGYAYRTTQKPRSPGTSGDEAYCDKDVPKFKGAISKYPEYRKRMILYLIKCEIEGGKKLEVCPTNLISGLSGSAWDETEGMDMTELKGATGFAKIQKLLDEAFKYKARTEMHHLWDDYIYGFRRSRKMTLQEYIGKCRHYQRRIEAMKTKDGIEMKLPEELYGWLLVRRGGFTKTQRELVFSACADDMGFKKVAEHLEATFGPDSLPDRSESVNLASDESSGPGSDDDRRVHEAHAAYTKARTHYREMKNARGFYPVVAMAPGAEGGSAGTSTGKKTTPPKGADGKFPPRKQSDKSDKKDKKVKDEKLKKFREKQKQWRKDGKCLNCGGDHLAKDCPKPKHIHAAEDGDESDFSDTEDSAESAHLMEEDSTSDGPPALASDDSSTDAAKKALKKQQRGIGDSSSSDEESSSEDEEEKGSKFGDSLKLMQKLLQDEEKMKKPARTVPSRGCDAATLICQSWQKSPPDLPSQAEIGVGDLLLIVDFLSLSLTRSYVFTFWNYCST